MKKPALAAPAVGALIVVIAFAVAVLAGDRAYHDTIPRSGVGPLHVSLCAARDAAGGADVAEARRIFADLARHALHERAALPVNRCAETTKTSIEVAVPESRSSHSSSHTAAFANRRIGSRTRGQ